MPLGYVKKSCCLVDTCSVQNASHSDDPGQNFYSPSFIDKRIERIHYGLIFHTLPFPCPPDTSPRESHSSIIELCSTSVSSMGVGMLSTPIVISNGLLILGIAPRGDRPWVNSSSSWMSWYSPIRTHSTSITSLHSLLSLFPIKGSAEVNDSNLPQLLAHCNSVRSECPYIYHSPITEGAPQVPGGDEPERAHWTLMVELPARGSKFLHHLADD